ncbi:MAG: FIST N-terminal domain-containing protein [Synechococcaceae cyanobacterium]
MPGLPSFPWMAPREPLAWCRTALAQDASLQGAVEGVARQLAGAGVADLALVFVSASFASDLPRLLPLLRQKIQAQHWLGCLGGGVVGTDATGTPRELEDEPSLSVTLLRLPGASLHPFAIDTASLPDLDGPAEPWRALLGGGDDPAAQPSLLVLVDPTTAGLNDLISGLDYAYPAAVKVGGVAAAHSARHGSLLLDHEVRSGAVGCLIGGAWRLEPVVAQGCRPIGPVYEVAQAQRNVVLEVSRGEERRSPVEALQTILSGLTPAEREQVRDSLFLGVARNAFSLSGGQERAPFLVRNLIGVDPRNGAVAVGEPMRAGQKVQFQLRDGDASRLESRQLLAECAARQPEPLAAFLFAGLGRGRGLYGGPDGDVSLCREAFDSVPISGVFCAGEIGPLGGATHLHGYTASWGFLVPVR